MRTPFALLAGVALSLSALPAVGSTTTPEPEAPVSVNAWSDQAPPPASERVIVRWDAGSSRAQRTAARASVSTDDSVSLGKRFQVLGLSEGQDPDQAVAALKADPAVQDAARDGYSELHATQPNDPLFNQLWGLENKGLNVNGVTGSVAGDDIDALKAWDKTTGDNSVIVADLDSGIRPQHPDLKNRVWSNSDEVPGDGIDNDGNAYVDDTFGMDFAGADIDVDPLLFDNDPTDDIPQGGHGVHTAGTIAAQGDNGIGITGVAQKATIMPLRVCGWSPTYQGVYCPFSSQIAGINYAGANGAKIANMSLGGTSSEPLVRDAFAANPQVLFVVSAGNSSANTELSGQTSYPCAWDPSTSAIPGAVDNVVCVAATDQKDAKASFSNWGKNNVDIAAPGTETLSTYVGNDVYKEDFDDGGFNFSGWNNGGWTRTSGAPLTSFGLTNDSATQGGTTRVVATPTITVQGPGWCSLFFWRKLTSTGNDDQANNDKFVYRSLVNGLPATITTGINQNPLKTSVSFNIPAGSNTIGWDFSFRKGLTTPSTNGVWIDDVRFNCYAAPGQETSTSYEFLQGTSMAAPHVTGAAALLAAYEPSATTMELKKALLDTVEPIAQLNPDTGTFPIKTGGRLNADQALSALDALVAPQTSITSGPSGSSTDTTAKVEFASSTKAPVSFECRVDGAQFSACTSPLSLSGLAVGDHTVEVRAKDTHGNADPTPASASWTVVAPVVPTPPNPPQQVLSVPTKVTGVSVKRSKSKAVIRWKPVTGATSYKVTVGKKSSTTTSPKFTLKKLKPKSKATVKITAVNSAGSSPVVTVKVKRAKA